MCQGISAPLAFACHKGDQLRKPDELSLGRACAFASRARNCAKGDPVVVAQDPVIVAGASRARIFAKGLPEVVAEYAVIVYGCCRHRAANSHHLKDRNHHHRNPFLSKQRTRNSGYFSRWLLLPVWKTMFVTLNQSSPLFSLWTSKSINVLPTR